MDENTPILSVMADFGSGPYAWLQTAGRRGIGACIADVDGFPEEYNVSKSLIQDFTAWIIEFESQCFQGTLDWPQWNAWGLALSRRLMLEIGDRYRIVYHRPVEDPQYRNGSSDDIFLITESALVPLLFDGQEYKPALRRT